MKKILIQEDLWQTRAAITNQGELQNIYFSTPHDHLLERSYFKSTVTKVLPGIQTAFVDINQPKAGFLHISEVDRELVSERVDFDDDNASRSRRQPPSMGSIFNEGEHILVQVSKEPINEKGAKLTTCFTLPGRFVVLMPNIPRIGISKKIDSRTERTRLRELVDKNLPEEMGAIIRTTSEGKEEQDIKKDISFLLKTWKSIQESYKAAAPGDMIHKELELPLQVVRDHLDDDVGEVITNSHTLQNTLHAFVKKIAPEHAFKIKRYTEKPSLFDFFEINKQIDSALHHKVTLKSGGSIVIETTEAMTVIDVNTGKFTGKGTMEETILKTNLEAAEEAARQLRLRNIGGLIVIDFIDMSVSQNKQRLFRFLEKTLKEKDKFQSVVLRISEFGLVQMTRKRSGKTLAKSLTQGCSQCKGNGFLLSPQTQSFRILEQVKQQMREKRPGNRIFLKMHPTVFEYLTTYEYNTILGLEKKYQCSVTLERKDSLEIDQYEFERKLSGKKQD